MRGQWSLFDADRLLFQRKSNDKGDTRLRAHPSSALASFGSACAALLRQSFRFRSFYCLDHLLTRSTSTAANEYAPPTYSNNGSSQMSQPYNNAPHTPIQPDVAYHNTGASPPHQQTPYGAPASPAAQPAGGYYGAPQPVHSDSYTKSEGNYPQGAGGMPQYQQQGHPQHPQQAHQPQYPQHHGSMGAPGQGGQQQQYSTLTPIPALTSAPAPVRCPACNATTMTRTQMTTGNTTQYVFLVQRCSVPSLTLYIL